MHFSPSEVRRIWICSSSSKCIFLRLNCIKYMASSYPNVFTHILLLSIYISKLSLKVSTLNYKRCLTRFFCFVANFNRKTIIPFPLSERYMKPCELKLVDGIHLFWLQLSLSFVIQIYLLILASPSLFLLDCVIQISQQRLSPGAPYHPSPRTIDGTQEKSTLSCFAFVCFELAAAVYWEFCGSGRRWFTGWSWEAGQRPTGPSLSTPL